MNIKDLISQILEENEDTWVRLSSADIEDSRADSESDGFEYVLDIVAKMLGTSAERVYSINTEDNRDEYKAAMELYQVTRDNIRMNNDDGTMSEGTLGGTKVVTYSTMGYTSVNAASVPQYSDY